MCVFIRESLQKASDAYKFRVWQRAACVKRCLSKDLRSCSDQVLKGLKQNCKYLKQLIILHPTKEDLELWKGLTPIMLQNNGNVKMEFNAWDNDYRKHLDWVYVRKSNPLQTDIDDTEWTSDYKRIRIDTNITGDVSIDSINKSLSNNELFLNHLKFCITGHSCRTLLFKLLKNKSIQNKLETLELTIKSNMIGKIIQQYEWELDLCHIIFLSCNDINQINTILKRRRNQIHPSLLLPDPIWSKIGLV